MNPNILLVEDDPVSRSFLEAATAALPAMVASAADAASARRLADSAAFDLWLFDANLPDATGAELLAQLRAAGHATPALAHTAAHDAPTHAALREAGFADVIAKPVDAAGWQSAVRRALRPGATTHVSDAGVARYGTLPTWDDAAALAALNGNAEHVAALRRLFLDELPGMRARIVDAATRGDALHRLRASCGFVGASALEAAVRDLQERGSEATLQRMLAALQEALDQPPSR